MEKFEKTSEEIESRNKAIIATVLCVLVILALMLTGCVSVKDLKNGQAYVHETQVEGIDLSIPIPFAENVDVVKLRFGFIQHKSYKGYHVPYHSDSAYKDISIIKGMGSVTRSLDVGIIQDDESSKH